MSDLVTKVEHKSVHDAIVAVMSEVGYVAKQRTPGLGYSYAGEAALIAALRPAMVEHGLYAAVIEVKDIRTGSYVTAKGTAMNSVSLTAVVRFTHAVSGTFVDVMAVGEGSDSGDKAFNKASTGAYKYALRQTFCIETGDDPDKYSSDEMVREVMPRSNKELVDRIMHEGKAETEAEAMKKIGVAYGELKVSKMQEVTDAQWGRLKASLGLK